MMRISTAVGLVTSLLAPFAQGSEAFSPRVIGGDNVSALDDAPYVAAIYVDYDDDGFSGSDFTCTASLISPSWVLTAAHCLVPEAGNPLVDVPDAGRIGVFYNTLFRATGEANLQSVDYVIANSTYDDFPLLYNDIALLHLSSPASGVDTLNLISAALFNSVAAGAAATDDELLLFGWGTTDDSGASYPSILQQVRLDYLDTSSCTRFWGGNFAASQMICAWEPDPDPGDTDGEDSCFGDSGGPLIAQQDGADYVVGITSFGASGGCGLINGEAVPGVYTRVASYINWIETVSRQSGEGALVDHRASLAPDSLLMSSAATGTVTLSLASATNAINGINLSITGSSADFSITPADATLSCSGNGSSTLSCTYTGTLASNSTLAAPLSVNWGGAAESTATLSIAVDQTEEDMRPVNNNASQTIVISASTDLVVSMPSSIAGTGSANGSISVVNRSVDVAAINSVLTLVSSGVSLSNIRVGGDAASCSSLDGNLQCDLGTIDGGTTATITYTASGGGGTVAASVSTETAETDDSNNSAASLVDLTTLILGARGSSSGGSLPASSSLLLLMLLYRVKQRRNQCSR